jgi:hypothetical protein
MNNTSCNKQPTYAAKKFRSVRRLRVASFFFNFTPFLVTLLTGAICPTERWVITRATRRNFREDTILHSHRLENLKS